MFKKLCKRIDNLLWPERKQCNKGLWSTLAALLSSAKTAAIAAGKGAVGIGKGLVGASKTSPLALGKTAASGTFQGAIKGAAQSAVSGAGQAATKGIAQGIGSKITAIGKDIGQGLIGKPTATTNLGNVLIKPGTGNLAQNAGSFMNSMGKQAGQMLSKQIGIEEENTSKPGIMNKISAVQSSPLMQQQNINPQEQPADIAPPQIEPTQAFAPVQQQGMPTAPIGAPQLSPADMEYLRRMRGI